MREFAALSAGAIHRHDETGRIALHLTALVVVGASLACWSAIVLLAGWVW